MAWLLFCYRLPSEPSAPRVAVWRALQRLEGGYLVDGAFATPRTALTHEVLRSLAHDVRNFGGEANVLEVAGVDDEKHLKARLKAAKR